MHLHRGCIKFIKPRPILDWGKREIYRFATVPPKKEREERGPPSNEACLSHPARFSKLSRSCISPSIDKAPLSPLDGSSLAGCCGECSLVIHKPPKAASHDTYLPIQYGPIIVKVYTVYLSTSHRNLGERHSPCCTSGFWSVLRH